MVDPAIAGILLNLISTGIAGGFSRAAKKIFRQKDIQDYLNSSSFRDKLERELDIENISDNDQRALEIFFKSEEITSIFAQIYISSNESLENIENEFTRIFCEIKPLNEKSSESVARELFFCIKQACHEILRSAVARGDLMSHEYLSEARHKENHDQLNRVETSVKEIVSLVRDHPDSISSKVPVEYVDSELEEAISLIPKKRIGGSEKKIKYNHRNFGYRPIGK